jgi:hypothetical protein
VKTQITFYRIFPVILSFLILTFFCGTSANTFSNQNLDWFRNAGYGVFVHYLYDIQNNADEIHSFGKQTTWDECINDFDTQKFALQMSQAGAGYVIFTMHQRTRFLIAPNKTFDEKTGYKPGEACSKRDLVEDLYLALNQYNIPLLLYWTGDGPRQDEQAAKGLQYSYEKGEHTKIKTEFVKNWSEVVSEYGNRYGTKVVGWWVDGCYQSIGYDKDKLAILARGLKSGNPNRIIALNNGVQKNVSLYSLSDNFTCGEASEFKDLPPKNYSGDSQWHILSYLGLWWGQPGTRFKKKEMAEYIQKVMIRKGVVSIDVMLYRDGSIDLTQLELLKSLRPALKTFRKMNQ